MSKYKDTKEKKTFVSSSVFIDQIEWYIHVHIQNLEDINSKKRDTYIGVYLHTNQKPRIW